MNRFNVFTDEEKEMIRYGLRNCSLYDFQGNKEQAVVLSLLEEISQRKIPFIPDDVRELML